MGERSEEWRISYPHRRHNPRFEKNEDIIRYRDRNGKDQRKGIW